MANCDQSFRQSWIHCKVVESSNRKTMGRNYIDRIPTASVHAYRLDVHACTWNKVEIVEAWVRMTWEGSQHSRYQDRRELSPLSRWQQTDTRQWNGLAQPRTTFQDRKVGEGRGCPDDLVITRPYRESASELGPWEQARKRQQLPRVSEAWP